MTANRSMDVTMDKSHLGAYYSQDELSTVVKKLFASWKSTPSRPHRGLISMPSHEAIVQIIHQMRPAADMISGTLSSFPIAMI